MYSCSSEGPTHENTATGRWLANIHPTLKKIPCTQKELSKPVKINIKQILTSTLEFQLLISSGFVQLFVVVWGGGLFHDVTKALSG